ncbi:MAG: hypothetical protein COB61_007190 [Thiotrichales bacterium]|nr:hypothetical protein [Thiotrichales bacterium]
MKPLFLGLAPLVGLAALTVSSNVLASSTTTAAEIQAQPLISITKPYSAPPTIHLASGDDHDDDDDDDHHDLSGTGSNILASDDDHQDDDDDDDHHEES